VRSTLEAALTACAETALKTRARRFLAGLSSDELQFIADFVGACILESDATPEMHVAVRLAQFQTARLSGFQRYPADQDHKMLVLLEFLCRAGMKPLPLQLAAKSA